MPPGCHTCHRRVKPANSHWHISCTETHCQLMSWIEPGKRSGLSKAGVGAGVLIYKSVEPGFI